MTRIFPQFRIPERLALEFLGTFARCEHALKCSGFAKGGTKAVEADWDSFAHDVDWHFRRLNNSDFHAAVDFLLSEPPRKQVLRNGHLEWKQAPPDPKLPKAQQTLLMVRRVRNNLFHGTKVWSPEYGNRPRDIRLLNAGLVVLKQCVRLNGQVQIAYELGGF